LTITENLYSSSSTPRDFQTKQKQEQETNS
jgi:hypothetical protein